MKKSEPTATPKPGDVWFSVHYGHFGDRLQKYTVLRSTKAKTTLARGDGYTVEINQETGHRRGSGRSSYSFERYEPESPALLAEHEKQKALRAARCLVERLEKRLPQLTLEQLHHVVGFVAGNFPENEVPHDEK